MSSFFPFLFLFVLLALLSSCFSCHRDIVAALFGARDYQDLDITVVVGDKLQHHRVDKRCFASHKELFAEFAKILFEPDCW